MRLLIDMVRGKSVDEALVMLKFTASPHARIVAKLIQTAVADAETAHNMAGRQIQSFKNLLR